MADIQLGLRIVSSGIYLPDTIISSHEIDRRANVAEGTTEEMLKIKQRHFAEGITASEMGAEACRQALEGTDYTLDDIDLIISASAVPQQPIPSQAALIHQQLGMSKIAAFDINATCLSFIQALVTVASYFHSGLYKRVLIVSSEKASHGLDWDKVEICGNFGDGAGAVVVEACPASSGVGILGSKFESWSEGANLCEIRGGGTLLDPTVDPLLFASEAKFKMDGPNVYKLAFQKYPRFLKSLFNASPCDINDIDLTVPHQASAGALIHLTKALHVPKSKLIDVYASHGNQVAASTPIALHYALQKPDIGEGSTLLLTGTAAGFCIAGAILRL